MNHNELRQRQQDEVNAFPIGAAFTNEQFDKMMANWGLKPEDTKEIASLGAGCFIRKKDIPAFNEMSDRHEREIRDFLDSDKNLKNALIYEFGNYECQISHEWDDALRALGLPKQDACDERTARVFKRARKEFWQLCLKNDWF